MTKIISFILFISSRVLAADLCPTVSIEGGKVDFTDNEMALLCGDRDQAAWATIPAWQAQLHIRSMLQARGYHHPQFFIQNGKLLVNLGSQTIVKDIEFKNQVPDLDVSRKRHIIGDPLTPKKIDELRDWLTQELLNLGYACANVVVVADPSTSKMIVTLNAGKKQQIQSIVVEDIEKLYDNVLWRYYAFATGDLFQQRKLTLSERRTIAEDIVMDTHFTAECGGDGVALKQSVFAGKPRLFRVGLGVDSEQGPSLTVSWQHSRLGRRGNSIDSRLLASLNIQELSLSGKWYYISPISKHYLRPNLEVRREKESHFETVTTQITISPSKNWDDKDSRWEVNIGPSLRIDQKIEGLGIDDARSLILRLQIDNRTHEHEYFFGDPQSGSHWNLDLQTAHQELLAAVTAQRLLISGQTLWNYRLFSPPLLVFGIRWKIGTTIVPDKSQNLPPTFRHYLGGVDDVRGFSRKQLPGAQGALTTAYVGSEARFFDLLPYNLQPFIFVDAAKFGESSLTIENNLFWSPGFGMRWTSPIGAFRAEVAYGFSSEKNIESQWQYHLAYGREF